MGDSAPTATLPRTASKRRGTAQPSGRSTEQPAGIVSSQVACAIRMVLVSNRRALWAVVNERDELGPDLVPDYMTSMKDGA